MGSLQVERTVPPQAHTFNACALCPLEDERMEELLSKKIEKAKDEPGAAYEFGCHADDAVPPEEQAKLAEKLAITRSTLEGRHVLISSSAGSEVIEAGKVLWVEAPYAAITLYENRKNHCHRCVSRRESAVVRFLCY